MKTRREFLKISSFALSTAALPAYSRTNGGYADVTGEIGVTTGSFFDQLTFEPAAGKIRMLDLPAIMQNELGMRVIDFMSRCLESFEPAYLDRLRKACDDHGCIVTNLKCNQKGLDMASADKQMRTHSIKTYKESIDAAHHLGARWIRPMAGGRRKPDLNLLVDAYHELIEYGARKNISILIENVGWVSKSSDTIPSIIGLVGEGLAASPDVGNWPDDATRYPGLKKAYPLAVTSDFKARQLAPDLSHPLYDLKKCFQNGWDAGFRGPWCIEHFHTDLKGLLKGFTQVRDKLRGWIAHSIQ
jgi:hypothetical protein